MSDDSTMRIKVTTTLGPDVGHAISSRRRNIVDDDRGARSTGPDDMRGIPGARRVHNGEFLFDSETCVT